MEGATDHGKQKQVGIVLGTMTFSKQVDEPTAEQIIDLYARREGELQKKGQDGGAVEIEVDTAFLYEDGKTEALLGSILKRKRDDVRTLE